MTLLLTEILCCLQAAGRSAVTDRLKMKDLLSAQGGDLSNSVGLSTADQGH
ncbi:MAG: hypothetical protein ACLRXQ_03090 [Phascolarctobacterium faecium]